MILAYNVPVAATAKIRSKLGLDQYNSLIYRIIYSLIPTLYIFSIRLCQFYAPFCIILLPDMVKWKHRFYSQPKSPGDFYQNRRI